MLLLGELRFAATAVATVEGVEPARVEGVNPLTYMLFTGVVKASDLRYAHALGGGEEDLGTTHAGSIGTSAYSALQPLTFLGRERAHVQHGWHLQQLGSCWNIRAYVRIPFGNCFHITHFIR